MKDRRSPLTLSAAAGLLCLCAAEAWAQTPRIDSLTPPETTAGAPEFVLTVKGRNYTVNSIVQWRDVISGDPVIYSLPTLYVSSTELRALVAASLLTTEKTVGIRVFNSESLISSLFDFVINPPPVITTASPLPKGTIGVPYEFTLQADDGTPPYSWHLEDGTLAPGLTLTPQGVITGRPTAEGTFRFPVRVTDSVEVSSATKTFSLTIAPSPVVITTSSPLPDANVGSAYSVTFAATGGEAPYTWSFVGGTLPPGLTVSTTGVLSGVPTTAGTYTFSIRTVDALGRPDTKGFLLTVRPPAITITTASPLPGGFVGQAYSVTFEASGGASPYSWALAEGSLPPGLLLSTSGALTGTPTTTGTYNFTVRVTDSAQVTVTKAFVLVISPPPLTITTASPLPNATLGVEYSQTLTASGGAGSYTWSLTEGLLPVGLTFTGGVLSGTPTESGTFFITVQVTDAASATATKQFTLTVVLPPLPPPSVTEPGPVVNPADQPAIGIQLASGYPVDISGQATLAFAPDAVDPIDNPQVQFSTGGRTVDFSIPAGQTSAVFPVPSVSILTGTVAGTITLTMRFAAGEQDITPSPEPAQTFQVRRLAPVITSLSVTRTANGFDVRVVGYATPRQVTQATFTFTARSGANLQTTQISVPVDSAFTTWYGNHGASDQYGSAFTYTQPFTVTGDQNAVASVSVTLTNAEGTSSSASATL